MRSATDLVFLSLALAVALLGYKPGSADATTAASGTSGRTGNPELKIVALPDPSFGGMPAAFIAVPAGWQADGRMILNSCTNLSTAAWNATSPDGQSTFDVLPQFGWRWGSGARYGQGCDPFNGQASAADFLKLFAAKLPGQVRITGEMPVAAAFRAREQTFTARVDSNNARLYPALRARNFGDVAALRAMDGNGHELRLRAWVQCRQGNQGGDCFAKVDVLRAAKGRLDALAAQVDRFNLVQEVPDQKWQAAVMNRQQQTSNRELGTLAANAKAGSDALRKQFIDSSARLDREHQAGLQQIEDTGRRANANDRATVNAMSTAASDWRDYAADQQTVSGANGTYKTSSQYTNVWSSPYGPPLSDGRSFGATDNTLNPNTATDNTFTQDHSVHGNGQPR